MAADNAAWRALPAQCQRKDRVSRPRPGPAGRADGGPKRPLPPGPHRRRRRGGDRHAEYLRLCGPLPGAGGPAAAGPAGGGPGGAGDGHRRVGPLPGPGGVRLEELRLPLGEAALLKELGGCPGPRGVAPQQTHQQGQGAHAPHTEQGPHEGAAQPLQCLRQPQLEQQGHHHEKGKQGGDHRPGAQGQPLPHRLGGLLGAQQEQPANGQNRRQGQPFFHHQSPIEGMRSRDRLDLSRLSAHTDEILRPEAPQICRRLLGDGEGDVHNAKKEAFP